MTDLSASLSAFMTRVVGPGDLAGLVRLSGGANMESWAFDWAVPEGQGAYVLRRGQIVYDGECGTLLRDQARLHQLYLGDAAG